MEYLDLYLLHWPMPLKPGDEILPMKDDKPIADPTPLIDTWRALEDVLFSSSSSSLIYLFII